MINEVVFFLFLLTSAAHAAGETAPAELSVEGTALVFDTETGIKDGEIDHDDTEQMRVMLQETPGITALRLNSGGGSISAAESMARIVQDYGLDTEVNGKCASACVTVFLAGKSRRMTRGSSIGFHLRSWSAADVADYYDANKGDEGWANPFEFASWVYQDTQVEVYLAITEVIDQGVDPSFAVKMYAPREKMWYPSRLELEAAGVLRP